MFYVEIRQPVRSGMIGPAQPERLQPLAHRRVGMGGLWLDPGADDIADQAVHRHRDPRVVPRIPPGPSRRRGCARQDRGVQAVKVVSKIFRTFGHATTAPWV